MDGTLSDNLLEFRLGDIHVEPPRNLVQGSDRSFTLEPRIMDVLCVLVQYRGDVVPRDTLIERIWQVEHGGDESLTRAISILRKTFREAGATGDVIETIPKRGYRLVPEVIAEGLANAAPAVLPQSAAMPVRTNRTATQKPLAVSRGMIIAAVVLTLGLGGHLLSQTQWSSPRNTLTESVTVTMGRVRVAPIEVNGDVARAGTFATQLRSEMSSLLLANGILTTFQDTASGAAPKLDLLGDIDAQDAGLRVTIRLVDHQSQLILWSDAFDRTYEMLATFEVEVSAKAAGLVGCILQWRPDAMTTKAETLALYARFCDASINDPTGFNPLIYIEPIYQADPENLNTISLYARALNVVATRDVSLSDAQKESYLKTSKDLTDKVLIADPQSPLANFVIANAISRPGNWAMAEDKFILATSQGRVPDMVYITYAGFLRAVGRLRAATALYEMISEAHPADVSVQTRLGFMYATQGEDRASKRQFERSEQLDPDSSQLYQRRIQMDVFLGDPEDAIVRLAQVPPAAYAHSSQYNDCYSAFARMKLSKTTDLNTLAAICEGISVGWSIRMFTALEDLDRAFALANTDDWLLSPGPSISLFYPDMAPFRRDPRFWPLVEKIGLATYWHETGRWPDFCETDELQEPCNVSAARVLAVSRDDKNL